MLLSLPLEIRLHVYETLLTDYNATIHKLSYCSTACAYSTKAGESRKCNFLNLLLTHPQIANEVQPLVYKHVSFTACPCALGPVKEYKWSSSCLQNVRRLTLSRRLQCGFHIQDEPRRLTGDKNKSRMLESFVDLQDLIMRFEKLEYLQLNLQAIILWALSQDNSDLSGYLPVSFKTRTDLF